MAAAAMTTAVSVTAPGDQTYTQNHTTTSITLDAASGGTGTYTYTVTGFPTGLSFEPMTRVLSGRPTATTTSGTVTATYTADDGTGGANSMDSDTFQITVNAAPSVSAPSNQTYTAGTAITNLTLDAATGGTTQFEYVLSNLPSDLSFNRNTRVLSGTPRSAGTRTVTHTARDVNGAAVTDTFTITVNPALESPGNLSFEINVNRTVTLPAGTGGMGTKRYSLTPGQPSGLSRTNNVISGTPTAVTSATRYTYTVSDRTGPVSVMFNIAAWPPGFNVPKPDYIYATVGVPISVTMPLVTSGAGTTTYGVMGAPYNCGNDWPDGPANGPGLPAGLPFNPLTRVLSGTPQHTLGHRRLTYTANGARDAGEFDLRVREPLALAQPHDFTVADGEAVVPVNLPRAQEGRGTYPVGYKYYDYSVSNLPFGLRYDPHRHRIHGTPR